MQKVTAKKDKLAVVYGTLKFFGKLMMIWPIDNSMKWYNRILLELFWWILIVNGTALIAGIIIGTYYFYKEVTTFTTLLFIVFEITVISESIYTSIYCKIQRQHLKVLVSILENTMNNVNNLEKVILRKYVKNSLPMCCILYTVYSSLAIGFTYLQIFEPNLILPKEVWHPFSIEPIKKKYLVLIQQLLYVFHTIVLLIADGIAFMSMHLARAKLEILNEEFKQVDNENKLKICIRYHQEAIWYVEKINITLRFIILKTVLAVAFYLTLGYLELIHKHEKINPLLVHQFLLMIAVVNYRMFFGALLADSLSTMGDNLRFSLPWTGKSSEISKSMYIIIHRCQKPLSISVNGIIPQYSLYFYANFMSFTFSYFLTLKAILKL